MNFSIKHDLARSCFQLWPKIGDEGDKISRKKTGPALAETVFSRKFKISGLKISVCGLKISISGLKIWMSCLKILIFGLKIWISSLNISISGQKNSGPPPEGMVPNSGPPPKEWFQILSLKMTSKKAKFAFLGRF